MQLNPDPCPTNLLNSFWPQLRNIVLLHRVSSCPWVKRRWRTPGIPTHRAQSGASTQTPNAIWHTAGGWETLSGAWQTDHDPREAHARLERQLEARFRQLNQASTTNSERASSRCYIPHTSVLQRLLGLASDTNKQKSPWKCQNNNVCCL